MPVTMNEPTSVLHRYAEDMEYCELLRAAAKAKPEQGERILHVACFAVSGLSGVRHRIRVARKVHNS